MKRGLLKLERTKRCIDCSFYPSDCGYWEDRIRPSTRVKPETTHNCPDYLVREVDNE